MLGKVMPKTWKIIKQITPKGDEQWGKTSTNLCEKEGWKKKEMPDSGWGSPGVPWMTNQKIIYR